jgi:hypothetical protein
VEEIEERKIEVSDLEVSNFNLIDLVPSLFS